jgi:hypothetical protein
MPSPEGPAECDGSAGAQSTTPNPKANKTFESWSESRSSIPSATQRALKSLEWVTPVENVVVGRPLVQRRNPHVSL